jgi:hypothetical protein
LRLFTCHSKQILHFLSGGRCRVRKEFVLWVLVVVAFLLSLYVMSLPGFGSRIVWAVLSFSFFFFPFFFWLLLWSVFASIRLLWFLVLECLAIILLWLDVLSLGFEGKLGCGGNELGFVGCNVSREFSFLWFDFCWASWVISCYKRHWSHQARNIQPNFRTI